MISPETLVFNKSRNLFALNLAKKSKNGYIILSEGNIDVVSLHQAGFDSAVASLGTSLTPEQARLISRYANEVIIAYDSDGAGQKATQKAINHFADVGLRTKILHMEGAKDPDEYIKKFGRDRFRMLIDDANDANDFMLDKCEDGLDLSTEIGRVELLKRTSKVLAGIESPLEREVYISRTSKKCDIPVQVLKTHIDSMLEKNSRSAKKNEWRTIKAKTAYIRDDINPDAVSNKKEARAEETIISYLLKRPQEYEEIERIAPPECFVTAFNKKVYKALLERMKNSEKFSISLLSDEFSTEETGRI
ncbi:toprim domain-containing protein, partial [Ruminococcus sp.]